MNHFFQRQLFCFPRQIIVISIDKQSTNHFIIVKTHEYTKSSFKSRDFQFTIQKCIQKTYQLIDLMTLNFIDHFKIKLSERNSKYYSTSRCDSNRNRCSHIQSMSSSLMLYSMEWYCQCTYILLLVHQFETKVCSSLWNEIHRIPI